MNLPPEVVDFVKRHEAMGAVVEIESYERYENIYEVHYKSTLPGELRTHYRAFVSIKTNVMSDTKAV